MRASATTLRQAALEFTRHGSPRLLLAHLVVLTVARVFLGPPALADLLIAGAVVVGWPLLEWTMHVHLLHLRPRRVWGWTIDPAMARVHRAHHRQPWHLPRVFLPVRMLVPLIPLFALAWWWVAPDLPRAVTGAWTLGLTTLVYEWIHYLTHTTYRPRSSYYRAIWRGHRLHHFKNERYWHAFTVPLVDTLLGTNPDPATVASSPTCRDLDADPR